MVVVSQIYASVADHLREFGTLKAMGASNGGEFANNY
jgi:ABC-type antimicrobial peptide transport system permease subunit